MSIPTNPEAFSTSWLEDVLKAPPGSLKGFSHAAIGTGQMCQSYRIRLDWLGYDGPASIVAKCPTADPGTRATAKALRNYTLELSWYRELSQHFAVKRPHCYFAESENEDMDFALLLEDMAPARQGDQIAGASVKQIEAALMQAANLHAPFWGGKGLERFPWLGDSPVGKEMLRALLPQFFAQFRERYATRLAPDILDMGAELVARFDRYQAYEPAAPTVQHRDFRIDNLLFSPNDKEACVVDWQTLGIGAGPLDVSYLIGTSIADPAQRAREEERLVAFYCDQLRPLGVACDMDVIWREYRLYAFSGFIMAIIAAMSVIRTERGDEMFAVMADRPARQALHLDSLSLL
jgi:hypothetical protein